MAALPDVPRLLRDAAFVSVGFGLLGVNRIQVTRRELTATLRRLADSSPLASVLGSDDRPRPAGDQRQPTGDPRPPSSDPAGSDPASRGPR